MNSVFFLIIGSVVSMLTGDVFWLCMGTTFFIIFDDDGRNIQ